MRDFNEPLPEIIQNILNDAANAKNELYDDLTFKGYSNRNIRRKQKPKKKKGSKYFFQQKH